MQIKKTFPLQNNLISCFSDKISIGVLTQTSKGVTGRVLDPDTLDNLGTFLIKEKITSTRIFFWDDILYLATEEGIIGYDSFSGQHVVKCASDNLIPLEFCCERGEIYAICGVPLVNSKHVNTENLCLSSYDMESGKHLRQSQNMPGSFVSPNCWSGTIWCPVGRILYKFNANCELTDAMQLSFNPTYLPIIFPNFTCISSEDGNMDIFDKKDKHYLKIFTEKNNSGPIIIGPDTMAWAGIESLHIIDVGQRSTKKIPLNTQITSGLAYNWNGIIYAGDKSGNLVSININTKKVETLSISKLPIWKPIVLNNYIFAISQLGITQCIM